MKTSPALCPELPWTASAGTVLREQDAANSSNIIVSKTNIGRNSFNDNSDLI